MACQGVVGALDFFILIRSGFGRCALYAVTGFDRSAASVEAWRWRESNPILDFLMSHLFSFIVTNEQLVKIERCYKVTLNAAF